MVFEDLCKTAGEKIYRTADNVEGVTLLKVWNDKYIHSENKLWEYAGLPKQYDNEDYIQGFLEWEAEIIPTGYPYYNDMLLVPEEEKRPYILHGPEEREHWIAHTRATVIDLQDNTVMATKDWYSFESQQGYGCYSMWVTAETCPNLEIKKSYPIRLFVGNVLKYKTGEQQ